ncbi:MAB_1171c family putative transporter [Streptomyces sp. NPDC060235]|uniref:MAB_1171c family putative transporter n=1 Tax=Streptomyces sp. NPDC060235 TaxID=3347080 RepID=UPI003659216A
MNGLVYYVAAAVLWTGLIAQVPGLWRHRREPLRQALCAVIGLSGLCFALGAPPTVALINRTTAIPNLAALLTYGAVTAFSAASLILIVYWQGRDRVRTRRTARAWLISYLALLVAQAVLFTLGDAPVERREDFDTYYASTPFIAEMIVLYLLAHMVAAVTTTVLCWRWTRHVKRWTRASLVLLAVGWLFTSAYSIFKLVALSAHWLGHRWDALSTSAAPLMAVGSCLTSVGYILPTVGHRVDSVTTLVRLRPLFHLLTGPTGGWQFDSPLSWRTIGNVELQLTARETAIRDRLKRLSAQFDDRVRQRAYQDALNAGSPPTDAETIAVAAMVAVAAHTGPRAPASGTGTVGVTVGDIDVVISVNAFTRRTVTSPRPLDTGQTSLLGLSRAIRTPIVDAAVQARQPVSA